MTAAAPVPDLDSAPFWSAAAEGRLLLQRCGLDGPLQWYPRHHCVADWNTAPEWVESTGRGVIYSYTIAGDPAAIFVLVQLDDGPVLSAELIDVPTDAVRIGMAVEVCFTPPVDGISLPRFKATGSRAVDSAKEA
jgi:uncharacterized OB-fold protein